MSVFSEAWNSVKETWIGIAALLGALVTIFTIAFPLIPDDTNFMKGLLIILLVILSFFIWLCYYFWKRCVPKKIKHGKQLITRRIIEISPDHYKVDINAFSKSYTLELGGRGTLHFDFSSDMPVNYYVTTEPITQNFPQDKYLFGEEKILGSVTESIRITEPGKYYLYIVNPGEFMVHVMLEGWFE